jgi:serine-threonine kinase receptor-associated protein
VWGVALDDKAMLAATGSADFTARLWDAITGEQKHEFVHKHIVKSVEFSRDGTKLATGGAEGMLRIFDVATPDADPTMIPVSRAEGKLPTITKVRWGQEPWMLLTGSSDGMVRAWDTRTSADSAALEVAVDGGVMDLEVSRVQPLVTVASGDHVTFLHAGSLKEVSYLLAGVCNSLARYLNTGVYR